MIYPYDMIYLFFCFWDRKSLFTGESAQEFADIDVNDPDFWKKVLPDLVTPESMLQRLNDEFDDEEEGEEEIRETAEKFMADMDQLMLVSEDSYCFIYNNGEYIQYVTILFYHIGDIGLTTETNVT